MRPDATQFLQRQRPLLAEAEPLRTLVPLIKIARLARVTAFRTYFGISAHRARVVFLILSCPPLLASLTLYLHPSR
jgi:hypothetical protein